MAASARSGLTVAVVNHDAVYLRLVDHILKTAGYKALLCPSGTAAHEVIAEAQPDVVMIDTWLASRDDGWVLLQTLRLDDVTRQIPILICSSDAEEVTRRAGQLETMPALTVLPKPFDPEGLLKKIQELTAGK